MRLALGGGHSTGPSAPPTFVSGVGGASGILGAGGSPISIPSGTSSESGFKSCHVNPL